MSAMKSRISPQISVSDKLRSPFAIVGLSLALSVGGAACGEAGSGARETKPVSTTTSSKIGNVCTGAYEPGAIDPEVNSTPSDVPCTVPESTATSIGNVCTGAYEPGAIDPEVNSTPAGIPCEVPTTPTT